MSVPERAFREPPREATRPLRPAARLWRRPRWRVPRLGRRGRWILGGLALLIALVVVASFLVDEPLRRLIEDRMNASLKGYTARIDRLNFHPIGASITLHNLVMIQDAHPDPPVLLIERLDASVQWKALVFGRVVADFRIERPKIYADRQHLESELKDPTPVKEHGWQEAFEAIYPLKINRVRIVEGEITYVDDTRFEPLRLSRIDVTAENIRNIRSKDRVYPSELRADAVVFDNGKLTIDGNADFLAEPHVAVKGVIELAEIPLDPFHQLTNRVNVVVQGGTLSARGRERVLRVARTIADLDASDAVTRSHLLRAIGLRQDAGAAPEAAA